MAALKAFTPGLARIMGMPAATVYEKQRSLVKAELLDIGDKWGPGSGVRTTAESVAILVTGILASDTIAATGARTRDIIETKPIDANRCPLTQTTAFLDALVHIITSRPHSHWVTEITVSRTAARASIIYKKPREPRRVSEFAGPRGTESDLRVIATLSGKALREIATDVTAMVDEKFEELAEEGRGQ